MSFYNMFNMKKPYFAILFVLSIVLFVIAIGNFFFKQNPFSGAHLAVNPQEYDFGKLLQSQDIVSTYFDVFNDGTEDIIIEGVPTSCGCTSAEIDKKIIKPRETAKLKVYFDPNFHEEPEGKFFRTAAIKSNAVESPEVKVWMEVEYDLGRDKTKFGKDLD